MADDFHTTMAKHQDSMTEEDQKKAGQAISGDMDDEHKEFMQTVLNLIDSKEIDPLNAQSFLNQDVYEGLDEEWKDKTDLALLNIANLIRSIDEVRRHNDSPNESPQMQTMIEHLWQIKQRIEEHYDVFKF
ncbi:hypothetical protein KKC44_03055 [Patescibacteria group bacterium]|nr:hypothetical protein [Patescibacteria group bacterium]MBU2259564.1 hypothetical protein [Patescibacteria group bacterium]